MITCQVNAITKFEATALSNSTQGFSKPNKKQKLQVERHSNKGMLRKRKLLFSYTKAMSMSS